MKKMIIKTSYIYEFLDKNNLTKKQFCDNYNFSYTTLNKILIKKSQIKLTTAIKMIKIINISLDQFIGLA